MENAMQDDNHFDLFIIGGGINGMGVAADAAGRGLRVAVCDRGDIGGETSSKSSKIFHSDIRFLENFEFGLVRKSLQERNLLMKRAPHLIQVLPYQIPCNTDSRPLWKLRLLLTCYDWMGNHRIGRYTSVSNGEKKSSFSESSPSPVKTGLTTSLSYLDCQVDDARLVISNALLAAEKGATILPYWECTEAKAEHGQWTLTLKRTLSKNSTATYTATYQVTAKALVNAAGPWANRVLSSVTHTESRCSTVLEKGSHIIIPRFDDRQQGYILQLNDRRNITVSPFQKDFYLLGYSSVSYRTESDNCPYGIPEADEEEIEYLLQALRRYFTGKTFEEAATRAHIKGAYSACCPLYDCELESREKGARDYLLDLQTDNQAPVVTIFGGLLTTYRVVAEQSLSLLSPYLKSQARGSYQPWTAETPLPGGNIPSFNLDTFVKELQGVYPNIPKALLCRYARQYGTRTLLLLGESKCLDQLGQPFSPAATNMNTRENSASNGDPAEIENTLYEQECRYLIEHEWAQCPEDILWRRTQLGYHLPDTAIHSLTDWWNNQDINYNQPALKVLT